MAGTIDMTYLKEFMGVEPKFFADVDGSAVEVPVDAIRWTLSDNMGGTFEQVGNVPHFVADKTHPMDTAARTALLKAEVDEAGVPNAFSDTWEVVVHGPSSPAATRMEMSFNVTDQA